MSDFYKKLFAALISLFVFVLLEIYDSSDKAERTARRYKEYAAAVAACTVVVEYETLYADPITQLCGSKRGKHFLSGTHEACSRVLARSEFAAIRHCWKNVLTPKNGVHQEQSSVFSPSNNLSF